MAAILESTASEALVDFLKFLPLQPPPHSSGATSTLPPGLPLMLSNRKGSLSPFARDEG